MAHAPALFLAFLAGGITRVARGFLLRQDLLHLVQLVFLGFFSLPPGLFLGLSARLLLGPPAGFLLGGDPRLFGRPRGLPLLARLGDGGAFLGPLVGIGLGGFGPGLGPGQHFGARLGGRVHAFGEFLIVADSHGVLIGSLSCRGSF